MSKKFFKVISLLLAFVFLMSVAQPAYTSNEGKMRVWVEFSPGRGAKVENALNALSAEFHYRFEDLNSFVVTVPEQALGGLRNNPNVVSIEEDAIRYPAAQEVPYGIDLVQARDVWDADRNGTIDAGAPTGAGIKVCIIDSGLWTGHEDFQGMAITGDTTTTWNNDTCGHGTHVAGTIAAQFNSIGVVGVTPGDVALHIVKVFDGPECGWSYSSTLANAAQKCQAAGADIISMSLGGGQKNRLEEVAFNNLYSAGILSIAAAGNEGTSANNYPASYSSVVSVAAIDANKVVADFSQFNSQVELAAPGVGVLSTVPFLNEASVTVNGVSYNGQPIDLSALGSASGVLVDGGLCSTTTGSWSGKVVLCQRGDISFYDKVMNVQNSAGVAAVIYNNEPGDLLGTLGEGNTSSITAIGITQLDGEALVSKTGQTAVVESSFNQNVSAYEAWDGTSMATPHVSGVAALIWSSDLSLTNVEVREALTSTAQDLGTTGRDVYYGYGLVQAKTALDSLGGGTPPPTLPMVVTVTTDKTIYSNNQTIVITVTAKDESGFGISSASVSASIVRSNDSKTIASLNGYTDSSGQVKFSYRVRTRTTGSGEFTVSAKVNKDGFTETTEISLPFNIN